MKPLSNKELRFAKTLKKARNEAGLTQEQLADKANLSTTYIGLLETGQRRPSLKTLEKLARILGIKTRDLISF